MYCSHRIGKVELNKLIYHFFQKDKRLNRHDTPFLFTLNTIFNTGGSTSFIFLKHNIKQKSDSLINQPAAHESLTQCCNRDYKNGKGKS